MGSRAVRARALDDLLNGKIKEALCRQVCSANRERPHLSSRGQRAGRNSDLKLGNLFLDDHLNIKIGDFG